MCCRPVHGITAYFHQILFYLFGFVSCWLAHLSEVNRTIMVSEPHLAGRQWLICQTVESSRNHGDVAPLSCPPETNTGRQSYIYQCLSEPTFLCTLLLDRQGVSNVDAPEVSVHGWVGGWVCVWVCVRICGNVCFQVYLHMNVCQRERCGLSYALLIVACWLRSALIAA